MILENIGNKTHNIEMLDYLKMRIAAPLRQNVKRFLQGIQTVHGCAADYLFRDSQVVERKTLRPLTYVNNSAIIAHP